MSRHSQSLAWIPVAIVMIAGCKGEVPVPSASAPVHAPVAAELKSTEADVESTTYEPRFQMESDFVPLSKDDFDSFGAEPDTWTQSADTLTCKGKPRGYLYSHAEYENFTVRLEYRFSRPEGLKDDSKFKGNTGFLVYITGDQKLWPVCIEVQGKNSQMAALKENGGAEPVSAEDDDKARQQARKPVGEWNALEIVSKMGALSVSLNGVAVSRSQAGPLRVGRIGIQAEDYPFEVRRMRIRTE